MANSVWRLIPLLSASGSVQMAIDQWLLEQHLAGKHPPTLRFYTWQPTAISLGYHQRRWPELAAVVLAGNACGVGEEAQRRARRAAPRGFNLCSCGVGIWKQPYESLSDYLRVFD